jgi:hypothetical protein
MFDWSDTVFRRRNVTRRGTESAEVAKSGVGYLSSSEAYTNNWGFFEKENYLAFDWWKQFLKILRRSEV